VNRLDILEDTKSGPTGITRARRAPSKEFVAIDANVSNPWALCKEYQGGVIPITYGNIFALAKTLTDHMTLGGRYLAVEERRLYRYPDRRAFKIQLRIKDDITLGGRIWLRDSQGRAITILDVKGLFQLNWSPLRRLYGTNSLVEIMERTRASLKEVGLRADQQDWSRSSSITSELWRRLDVNLSNVNCVQARKNELGNLQGYNVFGHTDSPVYFYDIHSAYLSIMAEFPPLKTFTDYLWGARKELSQANDPAEFVLKIASVVMPGKFTSTLPGNKFYRPVLGQYIRQRINDRLREAMSSVDGFYNRYRWCVDGFISNQDISQRLDVGYDLGQWKPVERHERLTIAATNVWWTDKAKKDNGFIIKEAQVLKDPEEIHTSRRVFDWRTLEEREEKVTLGQNHYPEYCRGCQSGTDLHDTLPKNVIAITD
jgi:hypothetical protein